MNIGVVGLGKLGCSMFAAFSAAGNNVVGTDINENSRNNLRKKIKPVSETSLQREIDIGFANYEICDTPAEVIEKSEVIYIVVPTPSLGDGTFDTSYLEDVIQNISKVKCNCKNKLLVITSTVLPGDTRSKLIYKVRFYKSGISEINFCYSPEFIALGSVLDDLKNPDFLLVGEDSPKTADSHIKAMMTIINNKEIPIRRMSIESAEMAKIAINSYITSKISFANAIGLTADHIKNCSSYDVLEAVGSDSRIGKKYLNKGLGFGGPCFPRDNRAIQEVINRTKGLDYPLPLNNEKFNKNLPIFYSNKITEFCKEKNIVNILLIGLSYKDGSHLLEGSQSYEISLKLSELFNVFYFDPDVRDIDVDRKIKNFNSKLNLSGNILFLNCSRDKNKEIMVRELLNEKNLNFFEFKIW